MTKKKRIRKRKRKESDDGNDYVHDELHDEDKIIYENVIEEYIIKMEQKNVGIQLHLIGSL